jgi:hypothetical protein
VAATNDSSLVRARNRGLSSTDGMQGSEPGARAGVSRHCRSPESWLRSSTSVITGSCVPLPVRDACSGIAREELAVLV